MKLKQKLKPNQGRELVWLNTSDGKFYVFCKKTKKWELANPQGIPRD